jgi:hypothetical protein
MVCHGTGLEDRSYSTESASRHTLVVALLHQLDAHSFIFIAQPPHLRIISRVLIMVSAESQTVKGLVQVIPRRYSNLVTWKDEVTGHIS